MRNKRLSLASSRIKPTYLGKKCRRITPEKMTQLPKREQEKSKQRKLDKLIKYTSKDQASTESERDRTTFVYIFIYLRKVDF